MNIHTTQLYDAANALVQLKIYDILNRYGSRKPAVQASTASLTNINSGDTFNISNTYNTINKTTTIDRSVTYITYEDDGKPGNGHGKGHKVDKKA